MWSRRDERVAKALLRFMRDPAGMLESVSESVEIQRRELRRQVTLRLRPGAVRRKQEWAYLDVLHPYKGTATELRVDSSSDGAMLASHADHLAVSAIAIQVRFLKVWRSALVPDAHRSTFRARMREALSDLARLPTLPSAEATAAVDRHFDHASGILRAVLQAPGTIIDAAGMNLLFQLCMRLQSRYLVLLKVRVPAGEGRTVTFSYPTEVDEYDVRQPGRQRPRPLRRHISYATPPASFRLHVPWAKRTAHYELHIDAPDDYFFSQQVLLLGSGSEASAITAASPAKWSINTGQGRHSTMFLGDAVRESRSIHAGLQSLEIPGRSTSRALLLGVFVTLTLLGFTLFATITDGPMMDTASLVVGLLAVGAFVVTPPTGPGVLGFPLLSRFTPAYLAFLSVLFIFWAASLETHARVPLGGGWGADVLHTIWAIWGGAGGWAIVAASAAITVRMAVRRFALISNFRRASQRSHPRSHNFR